jgi:nucleoside-diphosphate kinase
VERTLLIIKPNVVEKRKIGAVIEALEEKGIVIREMKMETLGKEKAEEFYSVHRGKPFFDGLVEFMTSGPVIEMVAEHANAVEYVRGIIGATDPAAAAEGTIRKRFGDSLRKNAVHASDSGENAEREIGFLFGNRGRKTE